MAASFHQRQTRLASEVEIPMVLTRPLRAIVRSLKTAAALPGGGDALKVEVRPHWGLPMAFSAQSSDSVM